jgi:hypothetical protein
VAEVLAHSSEMIASIGDDRNYWMLMRPNLTLVQERSVVPFGSNTTESDTKVLCSLQ